MLTPQRARWAGHVASPPAPVPPNPSPHAAHRAWPLGLRRTPRGSRRVATRSAWIPLLALALGCGAQTAEDTMGFPVDREPDATPPDEPRSPTCAWGIDELLGEVGARIVEGRIDCGSTNAAARSQIDTLYECFSSAPASVGALFTVNDCIDCSIPTTYVSVPPGEFFAIFREADLFGDSLREARVARCSSIELDAGPSCGGREELYACAEPLPR